MDGDIAPIKKIVDLKKKYKFNLMVDEAHSYGVFGYGIAYEENLLKDIDFLTIPLGKGGGSIGSYIICDEIYREYLINFGREIIYTTSLPPVNTLWNLFILEKMEEFSDRRKKLWELINFSKEKIKELEINAICDSQIMALIIGDNKLLEIIRKLILYPKI